MTWPFIERFLRDAAWGDGLFKGFGIFCETPTNADAIFAGPLS